MDIAKKLRSFVGRQGSLPPQRGSSPECVSGSPQAPVPRLKPGDEMALVPNPEEEEEVLSCIEAVYCSGEGDFDSSHHELKKLPEELDLAAIQVVHKVLRKQLAVVSKRVSDLILQNQSWYTLELQRVTELQDSLDDAHTVCIQGRRSLACTRENLTVASLGLLAACRRRQQLQTLLKSLHLIKALQETDTRLRELLEEQDYPGAIQLGLACHRAASTFKHYQCISELSSKLQETLEMTEEQLDVALSRTCSNFDRSHYDKLQAAYGLLGKTQMAAHQLLMHFSSAIHNRAFAIVRGYVETHSAQEDVQKAQYRDLCRCVPSESFLSCLLDLCQAMWQMMCSYKAILAWHQDRDDCTGSEGEGGFEARYVRDKLVAGLQRVWQDIQKKLTEYLLACNMSGFKFNQFIQVLDVVRRLMDIGEEFCSSRSEELQQSLKQQSLNYFKNYHRSCLEELRMFLENESWELVPVRSSFSLLQLQEFCFLRQSLQGRPATVSPSSRLETRREERPCFLASRNPFLIQQEEEEEDLFDPLPSSVSSGAHSCRIDSDDSDIPEELKKDYIDELTEEVPQRRHSKVSGIPRNQTKDAPFVTNTTLNILRQFGKYMKMMDVLHTIAFDVFLCMSQLFSYYLYTVYIFFAKEMSRFHGNCPTQVAATAKTARQSPTTMEMRKQRGNHHRRRHRCSAATTPHGRRRCNGGNSASSRCRRRPPTLSTPLPVAARSGKMLAPLMRSYLPSQRTSASSSFCRSTYFTSCEIRIHCVYITSISRLLTPDFRAGMHGIPKCLINVIVTILHASQELQVFLMRLSEVAKVIPIPKEATAVLWEHCIRISNRTFIEGFSQAKRCTPEGRAHMQLDYQQFVSKVEKLVDLRPLPDRDLVEAYIKAYYLMEKGLHQWIVQRGKEYAPKHLIGLVNCIAHLNKKGRQALLSLIEESDRTKK
ncbi:unnamed protein product [Ixodes hexagonus]